MSFSAKAFPTVEFCTKLFSLSVFSQMTVQFFTVVNSTALRHSTFAMLNINKNKFPVSNYKALLDLDHHQRIIGCSLSLPKYHEN